MKFAGAPRKTCANCVRKHLGQAAALLQESLQGYPDHLWLAIGHMAEAEAESEDKWPKFASKIRDERKKVESGDDYMPDFVSLIHEVTEKVGVKSGNSDVVARVASYYLID